FRKTAAHFSGSCFSGTCASQSALGRPSVCARPALWELRARDGGPRRAPRRSRSRSTACRPSRRPAAQMGQGVLRPPPERTETASFSKRSFLLFLLLGNEFARWRCRFTLDGDTC